MRDFAGAVVAAHRFGQKQRRDGDPEERVEEVESRRADRPDAFDQPVASEASRTIRDMRWKSGFTGCARIAMTPSWMSRASSL